MVYRAIGIMSGSSLDGLDIAFVAFVEQGGTWSFEIKCAACYPYPQNWAEKLKNATGMSALEYQLLHAAYGHYIGQQVNRFIEENQLHFQVGVIASHGHTSFHLPEKLMTAQLGDGAAIAAETGLPVISDLRGLDVALHGQGAPIVPIGEKLLFDDYQYFLNIGGIANISFNREPYIAFDICPANRVLNMLAQDIGKPYDDAGKMAAAGKVIEPLLHELNQLEYYKQAFPKSLANSYGIETVYPLIKKYPQPNTDLLRTYVEHIVGQISQAIATDKTTNGEERLLLTGGGAFNLFLVKRLQETLQKLHIQVVVPDEMLVKYKEALIMGLLGVLRWREEVTVLSSVTGAIKDSVGGAMWLGTMG